ncbi:hypothetical protein F6B41_09965 [Microbacterium lushaniae]|nr:hypothetical protein F6B41_09965 [Microbacterium lushaniae]
MSAHDRPRVRSRPFWGDARFLLGVLLVVVSVAGVWLVVGAARQTVPVLAAARTIVPGETLGADDVRTVDVALGATGEAYVAPGDLPEAAVATRTISAGELVPAHAVGSGADARVTTVVVDTTVDVPAAIASGARVELWHAPALERGRYDTPRILVADATVAAVVREEGVIGQAGATIELVIPRADVAATLAALSGGSSLSVVPVAGRMP